MNIKIIIILVLLVAIIGGVAFYFLASSRRGSAQNQPVTLTVWGLWEDDKLLQPAIDGYKQSHPNVTIQYVKQTPNNYKSRAETKIDAGEGPDIFMIHNTWLPMFLKSNTVSAMPETVMSFADFSKDFDKVVVNNLSRDKKVYAIPRGIDGLAMYYNEDLLKNAGVTVIPQTWEDFRAAAIKITVVNAQGKVQTAGAALGTTGNVDHWSDIVGLLFLENPGASLENPATNEGAEVLTFYTNFVTNQSQKTWDTDLESSTQAFAEGKLGFYFAPSWRAFEIKTMNPDLNFRTAPVPQISGKTVGWATYWAYAVSAKSAQQKESWEFVKYLTSASVQEQLYQQAAGSRLFGLPYSNTTNQQKIASDPVVGSFVNQAKNYESWYLASDTEDKAINDEIRKAYEDAINAVVFQGASPLGVLQTTQKNVKESLDKYPAAKGSSASAN